MSVLLYEPDPLEREALRAILAHEGFRCEVHATPDALLAAARRRPPVLVICSLATLPTALALAATLRALGDTPLVGLGSRLDDDALVDLFEAGFDDVLVRPMKPRLLVTRLENMCRRATTRAVADGSPERLVVGGIKLIPALQELHKGDRVIHLTRQEARLLYHLMANAGQIVPRARLEEKLWGVQDDVGTPIKTHICHLRHKVEDDPGEPRFIQTVRGVGYAFRSGVAS